MYIGPMYLKRLSTLIVFLMVVSSLVFWMRARHLIESTIPFYLVNCQTGESPDTLFEFYLTGMKISRCVYAGEGLILLFSVLLMGFVKAAFCRLTCLIYGSFSNYGTVSRFFCPRGSNHV